MAGVVAGAGRRSLSLGENGIAVTFLCRLYRALAAHRLDKARWKSPEIAAFRLGLFSKWEWLGATLTCDQIEVPPSGLQAEAGS